MLRTLVVAVLVWMALYVMFAPLLARGEDHYHQTADLAAHEKFYSNWDRPDAPNVSCCNLKDCYPTSFRQVGTVWEAKRREDGQWIRVPLQKFERKRESPDGRNHVCMQAPGQSNTVFCAILGEGT